MSRTKRLLVGFGLIEVMLAGLWVWLAQLAATRPGTDPEAQMVIGTIMGGAMGGLLGLGLVLLAVIRIAGRTAARSEP